MSSLAHALFTCRSVGSVVTSNVALLKQVLVTLFMAVYCCDHRPAAPDVYDDLEEHDHGLTFSTLDDDLVKRVSTKLGDVIVRAMLVNYK